MQEGDGPTGTESRGGGDGRQGVAGMTEGRLDSALYATVTLFIPVLIES